MNEEHNTVPQVILSAERSTWRPFSRRRAKQYLVTLLEAGFLCHKGGVGEIKQALETMQIYALNRWLVLAVVIGVKFGDDHGRN